MLLIVRHSERMDEISQNDFQEFCQDESSKSNRHLDCIYNDPPITENGKRIATTAGKTLNAYLDNVSPSPSLWKIFSFSFGKKRVVRIFASKLLRCVHTAYYIAKELNINKIYISKGLALTSAAILEQFEQTNTTFHFLSPTELQDRVGKDMVYEDCDTTTHPFFVPPNSWLQAVGHVAQYQNTVSPDGDEQVFNIIVAHRETIRNISNDRRRLPYCAIATINTTIATDNSGKSVSTPKTIVAEEMQVTAVYTPTGELVQQYHSTTVTSSESDHASTPAKNTHLLSC